MPILSQDKGYLKILARALPAGSEALVGARVLVTGAAGMIGSVLADMLYLAGAEVIALGRSEGAASARFGDRLNSPRFEFLRQDVTEPLPKGLQADYIVHAAGNAHPRAYALDPVGTMNAAYLGALNLLEHGRSHGLRRFLMISSGEVYGQPDENLDAFDESFSGYVDPMQSRSCYPSAKRAAETLCASYRSQYSLDVVVARPCHVYGPSQTEGDTRAVSQFLRLAAKGQPIILKSRGEQVRSYCFVADTAGALMTLLVWGESGQAYNIADGASVVSIRALAEMIASHAGVPLRFEVPEETEKAGYTPITRGVLRAEKLRGLGWSPKTHLADGISETLRALCQTYAQN